MTQNVWCIETCSQCCGFFIAFFPSGEWGKLPYFLKPNSAYATNSFETLNLWSVSPIFCAGTTVRYSISLSNDCEDFPKMLSPCMYCLRISKIIECVFSPRCVCVTAPEPWNRYTSISRARSEERVKPDNICGKWDENTVTNNTWNRVYARTQNVWMNIP